MTLLSPVCRWPLAVNVSIVFFERFFFYLLPSVSSFARKNHQWNTSQGAHNFSLFVSVSVCCCVVLSFCSKPSQPSPAQPVSQPASSFFFSCEEIFSISGFHFFFSRPLATCTPILSTSPFSPLLLTLFSIRCHWNGVKIYEHLL